MAYSKKMEEYLRTYRGRNLEYSMDTYGVWEVRGEDPNCDWGGYHFEPVLGRFEGTLQDVMEHAVELPGFWQWGDGGRFILTKTVKIDSEWKELKAKKEKLEKELEEINKKMNNKE